MPRLTFESVLHNTAPYDLKRLQKKSISWYSEEIKRIKKNRFNKQSFIRQSTETTKRLEIGKMYMFEYIAKHRDTLPVWDRYPLVLPFTTTENGFIGINLHYLPHRIRAWLLARLLKHSNEKTNKVQISWQLLSRLSRANVAEFATHRYLINHITTPFRLVKIEDYSNAIMLPMAGWYGNNRKMVNRFRRQI